MKPVVLVRKASGQAQTSCPRRRVNAPHLFHFLRNPNGKGIDLFSSQSVNFDIILYLLDNHKK
jgi:hypothetical protein